MNEEVSSISNMRGIRLWATRTLWAIAGSTALYTYLASIPSRTQQLLLLSSVNSVYLDKLGLDFDLLVRYLSAMDGIAFSISFIIGLVIFFSKPNHRMAIFSSAMLFLAGVALTRPVDALMFVPAHLRWIYLFAIAAGLSIVILFLYIFPEGRCNPPGMRIPGMLSALWPFAWYLTPLLTKYRQVWPPLDQPSIVVLLWVLVAVGAQVHRYRNISTVSERRQTRWVVTGALIASSGFLGFIVVAPQIAPQVLNAGIPRIVYILVGVPFLYLTYAALPVTLAIGVLKQSLWDVDLILNRTLVYVGVSGILAGMYTAGIKLMQTIFVAFTGNESDTALIFTTLAVASVFAPIKNTLQGTVDRRFKSHEEPRRVLQEFDSSLQSLLDVADPTQIPYRLLDKAALALRAKSGVLYMIEKGEAIKVHTYGDWTGDEAMRVPIRVEGTQLGWLALGPSQSGKVYDEQDRQILEGSASRVARMLSLSREIQAARLSNVSFE